MQLLPAHVVESPKPRHRRHHRRGHRGGPGRPPGGPSNIGTLRNGTDQVAQNLQQLVMIADLAADAQQFDTLARVGVQIMLNRQVDILKKL